MSLTDTKVKNARPAEKAVKLTDGFGLYLLVHPNGSKYWQLGYRFPEQAAFLLHHVVVWHQQEKLQGKHQWKTLSVYQRSDSLTASILNHWDAQEGRDQIHQ